MKADVDPNVIVYFGGQYVPMREARVGILTHALHYGTGVFEGHSRLLERGRAGAVYPAARASTTSAGSRTAEFCASKCRYRRRSCARSRWSWRGATHSAPISTSGRWPTSAPSASAWPSTIRTHSSSSRCPSASICTARTGCMPASAPGGASTTTRFLRAPRSAAPTPTARWPATKRGAADSMKPFC